MSILICRLKSYIRFIPSVTVTLLLHPLCKLIPKFHPIVPTLLLFKILKLFFVAVFFFKYQGLKQIILFSQNIIIDIALL